MQIMSNEVKQSPVLKLKPGTVSADVIVCGDAARALKIAQHFDSYEQVAARREYVVYTGIKNGHRLTVAAHGVGAAGSNQTRLSYKGEAALRRSHPERPVPSPDPDT